MRTIVPSSVLRGALRADSAASALFGGLQLIAAGWVSDLTKLPHGLVLASGLFLVVYTALVAVVARGGAVPWSWIAAVIVTNMAWAVAGMTVLAFEVVAPSGIGLLYVLFQIVTFFSFAGLELAGLRASRDAMIDDGTVARA